ncbi:hypothetical protein HPB50_014092 [Hyalomma asiaticum]|uniref:Uncharacterized protein n=1 Tax=Hyalomma asiaticum TaxID=266040 RepID=A0ACB7S9Z3_HYAAI|nr:hypothetical protein HPB50_014092 [Hyalomma asiaticum]
MESNGTTSRDRKIAARRTRRANAAFTWQRRRRASSCAHEMAPAEAAQRAPRAIVDCRDRRAARAAAAAAGSSHRRRRRQRCSQQGPAQRATDLRGCP